MLPQQHFKLTRQAVLLATIAAAFPVTGYCVAAGHADFVIGDVVAIAADGSQRSLVKGSEINSGESINTVAGARAHIRFTDGGYVSLQPNSQFRVDQYQYQGKTDGGEKGFFSLLKGGLRAITGAIGHTNHENYKVATTMATLGIRGTGYNAVLGEGLAVSVADGVVSLTNKGGTLILSQGQSAFVADVNTAPTLTFEKPATPPAKLSGTDTPPPKANDYVTGDCIGNCGGLPNAGLIVMTGVAAAFSGTVVGGPPMKVGLDYPGIVKFNMAGTEVSYAQASPPAGAVTSFAGATLDTGVYNGFPASGYDGTIGWGRFYGAINYSEPGGFSTTTTFSANQGMHSVVGIPTPTAAMPTSGFAYYGLAGATRPTLDSGGVGTVSGGSMYVSFAATPYVSGGLSLAVGTQNYNLSFYGNFTGNTFTPSTAFAYGSSCSGSCAASVAGFFAGANAARAGVSYGISTQGSTVRGAAVYSTAVALPPG